MARSLAYNHATKSHPTDREPMNRAYLNRIVRLSGGAFARGIGGED
jgi:hypothetical protein